MNEKLPQKINNPETTENIPSLERAPIVESMYIGHAGVLVRVLFPRPGSVAKLFMLVQTPTSEAGMKNVGELVEKDPKHKELADEVIRAMNSPVIFRTPEEAQQWFDLVSHNYEPEKRSAIANFLEVENK